MASMRTCSHLPFQELYRVQRRVAQSLMSSGKLDVMYADALVEQSAVPTIPRFDLCRWDKATLETFDRIIISFKVPGLDMALLDKLDSVQVEKWYQWR